jgi:hypothetical protein
MSATASGAQGPRNAREVPKRPLAFSIQPFPPSRILHNFSMYHVDLRKFIMKTEKSILVSRRHHTPLGRLLNWPL